METLFYRLVNRIPEPVADYLEWAEWFATAVRVVRRDTDERTGAIVSTVFLGINHQYGAGVPLLFETMVFTGEDVTRYSKAFAERWNRYQERHCTWQDAVTAHEAVLSAVHVDRR